jgi:predicted phosphoribosyltransferase
MGFRFRNRREAGVHLAKSLQRYADRTDVRVLALPRGGVPVGFEVARALKAPFDVFVVRKLGVPGHEEFAMGAIASGDVTVLDDDTIDTLRIPAEAVSAIIAREQAELGRRERRYRHGLPPMHVEGQTVILVDDGLATGASMRAAVRALKALRPAEIVVAVPVASAEGCHGVRTEGAACVCALTPEPLYGVGVWYADFSQTEDVEVEHLLATARQELFTSAASGEAG